MRLLNWLFIFLAWPLIFLPAAAKADTFFNLSATPSVIDVPPCEKSQICLKKDIAIKNNSGSQVDVYAQVNDLSTSTGLIYYSDPSQLPIDASLVRWMDFYRGAITIKPGEIAAKTLIITASPNAIPGKYHAIISFPVGNNLPEAQQANQELNEAKVQINMEVVAHQVEQAEVNFFQPSAALFTDNNISFILKIKNIGTEAAVPAGEIIIYDKNGQDVASIPIAGESIAPGETKIFPAQAKLNIGPGKFKAILSLNYGPDNGKNLSDVVYFSYLPLILFLVLLIFILGLIFWAAAYIHKKRKIKKHLEAAPDEHHHAETPTDNPHHRHHKYIINLKK